MQIKNDSANGLLLPDAIASRHTFVWHYADEGPLLAYMTHVSHSLIIPQPSRGGGRIASPLYRKSLSQCEDFAGLEEGADRYKLLLLVKKVASWPFLRLA